MSNEFELPGFRVETLRFRGVLGNELRGWFAIPEGVRRAPGILWLNPYGRDSRLPNAYTTRPGFATLAFNFHGESSFHEEAYVPSRGYFADGVNSPHTWIFKRMVQDALIALRLLQAQVEVDEDRIGSMGMSQGGGMAIWLGALSPIVKAVCADMPFLCAMDDTLSKSIYRYPLKELFDFAATEPLGIERVRATIAYFDTVNFATRCFKPTQVSLGLKDPASRPPNVRAAYNALPDERRLMEYDWGHDWTQEMVTNNQEWLQLHL